MKSDGLKFLITAIAAVLTVLSVHWRTPDETAAGLIHGGFATGTTQPHLIIAPCVIGQWWGGARCWGEKRTPTWQEATKTCQNLEQHGYHDWRLPSLEELSAIAGSGKLQGGLATETHWLWTASDREGAVQIIHPGDGRMGMAEKNAELGAICVRSQRQEVR